MPHLFSPSLTSIRPCVQRAPVWPLPCEHVNRVFCCVIGELCATLVTVLPGDTGAVASQQQLYVTVALHFGLNVSCGVHCGIPAGQAAGVSPVVHPNLQPEHVSIEGMSSECSPLL